MRILVIVGRDFAENAKRRKGKVFSSIYVRRELVSNLSCILTEYDDGHRVNIPVLIESYIVYSLSDKQALERVF